MASFFLLLFVDFQTLFLFDAYEFFAPFRPIFQELLKEINFLFEKVIKEHLISQLFSILFRFLMQISFVQ